MAWTGEGPGTCSTVAGNATLKKTLSGGTRTTSLQTQVTTGAGQGCVWIEAVNSAGASPRTLAKGTLL